MTIDTKATMSALLATATAQVAKYPQYAGHFANYKLARVKKDIRTKMGLAFMKGEYVLAKTHPAEVHAPSGMVLLSAGVTAWSRRNACDTALKTGDVEWVLS